MSSKNLNLFSRTNAADGPHACSGSFGRRLLGMKILAGTIIFFMMTPCARANCQYVEHYWLASYFAWAKQIPRLEYAAAYMEALVESGNEAFTSKPLEQHQQFLDVIQRMISRDLALASAVEKDARHDMAALRECELAGGQFDVVDKQALRAMRTSNRLSAVMSKAEKRLQGRIEGTSP
jgi:hypothetical protein